MLNRKINIKNKTGGEIIMNIHRKVPIQPCGRILKGAGAERVGYDASIALSEALGEYGTDIARRAISFAHHAGRKTVKAGDVKLALKS